MDDLAATLDLNLLRLLIAVHDARSVTAAAVRLDLTQSAVSNGLRRLRQACGDPLFIRTPDGMMPTPYATRLAGPVARMLDTVGEALARAPGFDPTTSSRLFTLRMTDIGEAVFVPRLATAFSRLAPAATLRTVLLSSGDTASGLARGEVDLAIGFLPDLKGDWYQQRLFEQRYVCLAAEGHPAWKRRAAGGAPRIGADAFRRAQHLVIESPGSGHLVVEAELTRLGVRRDTPVRMPDFVAAVFVVAQTGLVCTVPHRLAEAAARLAPVRWCEHPFELPTFAIRQYWHARFHHDAACAWLRRLVAQEFAEPGRPGAATH